jgi:hypothetical protein
LYCQTQISEYLKSISADIKIMHEFTDGCSAQYKNRNFMGDVSRIHGELGYSKIIRNFYETSHAKGSQDAAGGFLKHQADMAVLRGSEMIQNANDFFDFVDSKLRIPQSGIYKRRVFRYAEEIPEDKIPDYKPVNKNRKNSSNFIKWHYRKIISLTFILL